MTPAIERLVRLMILLPEHDHPLWKSVIADCGDTTEVMSMRWFVGDAAKMWPEAGARNLANAVLTVFGAASEGTLRLISNAILDDFGRGPRGPQAGAAWVAQANAAAIEVLAHDQALDQVLQEVTEKWTLST
jgi:hypothetical protein